MKSTSTIDFNNSGTYEVRYEVKDSHGNVARARRVIRLLEDPLNTKLAYDHDMFDNTMFEWWFNKSQDHQRTTAAKSEDWLAAYSAYYQGPDEKVIYLTFDEGGNDITYIKEIADVLNENDVKATFFLTRNYIRNESAFVRELVDAGSCDRKPYVESLRYDDARQCGKHRCIRRRTDTGREDVPGSHRGTECPSSFASQGAQRASGR